MAPQTRKIQRPRSHEISFIDQLRPGLLGKVGSDTFLHARTQRVTRCFFPHLRAFDYLRLVEQSSIQSSTGF